MTEPDHFLTPKQAASLLGMNVFTLYKWAQKRRIPSYKLDKLRRFKASELAAWAESKKVNQAGQQ